LSPVFRHGSLRLYLLRLLDEEPRHGYEVIRLLRDRFMGVYSPSPGTIYPRLARLEEEGLVTHDEVDGRKVYRITEAGRDELRSRSDELDELEEELSASVSDIVREVREDVRQTVRSLREELTWAARESRRMGKEVAADVREQARQARDEAREQARQARDEAREQVKQTKEQAREQARQAREDAREGRDPGPGTGDSGERGEPGDSGERGEERGAASGAEGPGPEAARRVHEQARRLREEARRARDEAMAAGRLLPLRRRLGSLGRVRVGPGTARLDGLAGSARLGGLDADARAARLARRARLRDPARPGAAGRPVHHRPAPGGHAVLDRGRERDQRPAHDPGRRAGADQVRDLRCWLRGIGTEGS
jgi:DNA-binding PadR family transcriptional regulator